jgi:hypothetical protein
VDPKGLNLQLHFLRAFLEAVEGLLDPFLLSTWESLYQGAQQIEGEKNHQLNIHI